MKYKLMSVAKSCFIAIMLTMGLANDVVCFNNNESELSEDESESSEDLSKIILEFVDDYMNNNKNKLRKEHFLIQAILNNDLDTIKQTIENGAQINYQETKKEPLFVETENNSQYSESDEDIIDGFLFELENGYTPFYDRN